MSKEVIKYFEKDRFAAYAGIKLVKAEPGYAETRLEIEDKHLNSVGVVQGGVIFTLADFAFAAAANANGNVTLGIDANISYFRAPQGSILTAEAREISSYKKFCSYNVDIFDEEKELVARFTAKGYRKKDKIEF